MTKICFISDTHNREVDVEPCDILCHTGDATNRGSEKELHTFFQWFVKCPADNLIYVPGNHDFGMENLQIVNTIEQYYSSVNILIGQSTRIGDLSFYGHPWVPQFYDWAFMPEIQERQKYIDMIPEVDILLCHGPVYGVLDYNGYENCGDHQLYDKVKKLKPKIMACGHIHEGFGWHNRTETTFINSAQCPSVTYYKKADPVYVILDDDKNIEDIYFHGERS